MSVGFPTPSDLHVRELSEADWEAIIGSVSPEVLEWVLENEHSILDGLGRTVFSQLSPYEGLDAYHELDALGDQLFRGSNQEMGLLPLAEILIREVRESRDSSSAYRSGQFEALPNDFRGRVRRLFKRAGDFTIDTLDALERAAREAVRLGRQGRQVALNTASGVGKFALDIAATKHARRATEILTGVLLVSSFIAPVIPGAAPLGPIFGAGGAAAVWVNTLQDELAKSRQYMTQQPSATVASRPLDEELQSWHRLYESAALTQAEFEHIKRRLLESYLTT